jgi:hypothetical protein
MQKEREHKKTQRAVAHLAKRWFEATDEAAALNPGCIGKQGHASWDCCNAHQCVKDVTEELAKEAEKIHHSHFYGPFSANWWRAVGRQDIYDKFTRR